MTGSKIYPHIHMYALCDRLRGRTKVVRGAREAQWNHVFSVGVNPDVDVLFTIKNADGYKVVCEGTISGMPHLHWILGHPIPLD